MAGPGHFVGADTAQDVVWGDLEELSAGGERRGAGLEVTGGTETQVLATRVRESAGNLLVPSGWKSVESCLSLRCPSLGGPGHPGRGPRLVSGEPPPPPSPEAAVYCKLVQSRLTLCNRPEEQRRRGPLKDDPHLPEVRCVPHPPEIRCVPHLPELRWVPHPPEFRCPPQTPEIRCNPPLPSELQCCPPLRTLDS